MRGVSEQSVERWEYKGLKVKDDGVLTNKQRGDESMSKLNEDERCWRTNTHKC